MKDIDTKDKVAKIILESLRNDINEKLKKTENAEEALSKRIDILKDESDTIIDKVKKNAASEVEDAFLRAAQYADQKVNSANNYANELYDSIVTQFDERIGTLTDILGALNIENAKLREELNEQKKKLNFFANIEEAAESLTVEEDTENRKKTLEAIEKQIISRKITESEKKIQEDTIAPVHNEETDERCIEAKSLDKEQEFARDYMDNTTENVFITGKAGTGKSFLLDIFRNTTYKANIVLAPTGISALNINGATLHSTFGYYNLVNLDVDDIVDETIRLKSEKRDLLKRVNTIIIDEISMVRADTFDKIDRILKVINGSDLPFGGKQIFLFGDLFQLPPVTRGQEYEYLHDKYGGVFFFHSDAYKAGNFKFIELTENHRQKKDEVFFDILNRIRIGEATDSDIDLLNTRYTPNEDDYDRYTVLLPTKAESERVNRNHMKQIKSMEYVFNARTILDKNPNKNKTQIVK